MYMALVKDPDFNIIQQSHGLFAITKLLACLFVAYISTRECHKGGHLADCNAIT